jgi:hypothetical protein
MLISGWRFPMIPHEDQIFRFKGIGDAALHRPYTDKGEGIENREKDVMRFMELLAIMIRSAPDRPEDSLP